MNRLQSRHNQRRFQKSTKGPTAQRQSALQTERDLLNFDLSTSVFKLLLETFSICLGHAFLNSLGSTVNQVLRFLQTLASSCTYNLDYFNLLFAAG